MLKLNTQILILWATLFTSGIFCLNCGESDPLSASGEPSVAQVDESELEEDCMIPTLGGGYPPSISHVTGTTRTCLDRKVKQFVARGLNDMLDSGCIIPNDWGEIGLFVCDADNPRLMSASYLTDAVQMATNATIMLWPWGGVKDPFELPDPIVTPTLGKIDGECRQGCARTVRFFDFSFGPQYFEGLLVAGSQLNIRITSEGVAIYASSWRADLDIPTQPLFSASEGRAVILGDPEYGSDFYDIGSGKLVIYRNDVYGARGALSYHLAWQYPIDDGCWTGYVDAITNQLIGIVQNCFFE